MGARERRMIWLGVFAMSAIAAVSAVALVLYNRAEAHDRLIFARIRDGEAIEATAIVFDDRQGTELTDTESVNYFMAALREARPWSPGDDTGGINYFSGYSYDIHVRLAEGSKFTLCVSIPDHDKGMTLYTRLEGLGFDDPDYFLILFPAPMPGPLAEVLKQLRRNAKR